MVTFAGVAKRFGEAVVLHELNLVVPKGQFVSLIGPSGSGKTTILRLLMALERVDSGRIHIGADCLTHTQSRGREVPADEAHLRRVRRRIGMVFQQFNLFPHMSVLGNVTEGPIRALGLPRTEAEARAEAVLETVGMRGRSESRPRELSGGQQQRVAIARALAMQPELLLLDEITSALDPELISGVLDVLREVASGSDITIMCVTHEMGFARKVSDRVLMLDSGHVIEDAHPEKLFTDPDHRRTREFLHAVLERS